MQHAGIAALTGPQESVAERRDTYQRRRDRVLEALAGTRVAAPDCEGTFYVWIQLPDDRRPTTVEMARLCGLLNRGLAVIPHMKGNHGLVRC